VIRPLTAPTAPPTAAPRAAPCPPAAAAPIAAPLPAPIRPPPIVRWTGSYGLVQADSHRSSPTATTPGVICDFVISLVPIRHRYSPEGRRIQTSGPVPTFRRVGIQRCHRCMSFLAPKRVGRADKFVNRVDPAQPTTIQPPTSSRTACFYNRGRIYAGAGATLAAFKNQVFRRICLSIPANGLRLS
jgi:hypothetical protein